MQGLGAVHALAVGRHHHVARLQPGCGGGRAGQHAGDQRTAGFAQAQALRDLRGQVLDFHAQRAAHHHALGDQLLDHVAGEVGGNGQAQADVAGHAALRVEAGGIDADQLALQVDQRATGVARIDRRIGLDEVLVAQPADAAAAHRRNDTRGNGLAEAERVADGHHEVAYAQLVAVAELDVGQVLRRDADQRDVGVAVRAEELGLDRAPVRQCHLYVIGVVDDMVVGQHQALLGVDDHARAQRFVDAFLWDIREQAAEERVVEEGVAHAHHLLGVDTDHRRHCLFQHRCQRRHRLTGHRSRQGRRGRQHRRQRRGVGTVVHVGIDAGGNEATEGGGDCEREQGRKRSHGSRFAGVGGGGTALR